MGISFYRSSVDDVRSERTSVLILKFDFKTRSVLLKFKYSSNNKNKKVSISDMGYNFISVLLK